MFIATAAATVGVSMLAGKLLGGSPDTSGGDAAKTSAAISADQWNYYKQNYQPLESNLIEQANKAGSPEEYAAAAGRANADVTGGYDAGNKVAQSTMQSYGINPGSPAYGSAVASEGLAEGGAKAGALTQAYNTQKQLAYSKALDVVGLGRNIPAQSAASSTAAGNLAQNASNSQFYQNQQNMQNVGQAIQPLVKPLVTAAKNWYNTPSAGGAGSMNGSGSVQGNSNYQYDLAEGGKVPPPIDATQQPDGSYAVPGLEPMLAKKGIHPVHAKTASNIKGYKPKIITPHMRFTGGGGVGRQGLETRDMSNMGDPSQSNQVVQGPGTETSDSIPAQVDGQHQAALSSGEYVMNAEVPKLSGDEILTAINNAGLQKRNQNVPQPNAGMTAYARGGRVYAHA